MAHNFLMLMDVLLLLMKKHFWQLNEHNIDNKTAYKDWLALLKGLMGHETWQNLCLFYTIIFYVAPVEASPDPFRFLCLRTIILDRL